MSLVKEKKEYSYLDKDDLLSIICLRKRGASKQEIIKIFKEYNVEINNVDWNRIKYFNQRYDGVFFDNELRRWKQYSEHYSNLVSTVYNPEYGAILPRWIKEHKEKFKKTFPKKDYC